MVHNRARMIAASFLAKQLMVDFRRGEGHYLEHLVDGNAANNDMGWQWSSGMWLRRAAVFPYLQSHAAG